MKINPDGSAVTFRTPDNWHAHFRQGTLRNFLVKKFIDNGWNGRIIAMPNTEPPLLTGDEALIYTDEIKSLAENIQLFGPMLDPVPVIQITESTTAEVIYDAFKHGVRFAKVYPFFVTTNSKNGVKDYLNIYPALRAAEEVGMTVLFHGEDPDPFVEGLHKEVYFLNILDGIVLTFPHLRLTLEHVTSAEGVEWVKRQGKNVAATVTIHHLLLTLDDVIGYSQRSDGRGCVHHICKPSLKFMIDRAAIQQAVLDGNPKFFYGGDDAAHPRKAKKENFHSACGVWNTIAAMPLMIKFFKDQGCLERIEPFTSEFGANQYGFELNKGVVTYIRNSWKVPLEEGVPGMGDTVVPFWFGDELEYQYAP